MEFLLYTDFNKVSTYVILLVLFVLRLWYVWQGFVLLSLLRRFKTDVFTRIKTVILNWVYRVFIF